MNRDDADLNRPPTIGQIRNMVDSSWLSLNEQGIGPGRDSILSAAAVGLVEKAWRNSPVEDAHASRRGPDDGQMMAESLHLHTVAHAELSRDASCSGLLAFERYVLDFERSWHGTARTVKDMLYGHLGEFRKHVKQQTNTLIGLANEGGSDVMLGFLCLFTRYYGRNHYGMPTWRSLVDASIDHLSHPTDPCWDGRYHQAVQRLQAHFKGSWSELGKSLRERPQQLDPELLQALIGCGLLMYGEAALNGGCKG